MFKRFGLSLATIFAAALGVFSVNATVAEDSARHLMEAMESARPPTGRSYQSGGYAHRSPGGRAHRRWAHARASGLKHASRS